MRGCRCADPIVQFGKGHGGVLRAGQMQQHAAGLGDARGVVARCAGERRQGGAVAQQDKAVPSGGVGFCPHGLGFEFRLAGERVEVRRNQGVDQARTAKAIVPVHRREQAAGALAVIEHHAGEQLPEPVAHAGELVAAQFQAGGIGGMHAQAGFLFVGEQFRHRAGAAHAVPLIAQPAGVQAQRHGGRKGGGRTLRANRDHAGAAVRGEKPAIGEQRRLAAIGQNRPARRRQGVVGGAVELA